MRFIVTQEIKSPAKVAKGIYVQDFFFLLIYAAVSMILSNLVNGSLVIPYGIFSAAMALWLTGASRRNPGRKKLQSLFLFIRKDRTVYRPATYLSMRREEEDT